MRVKFIMQFMICWYIIWNSNFRIWWSGQIRVNWPKDRSKLDRIELINIQNGQFINLRFLDTFQIKTWILPLLTNICQNHRFSSDLNVRTNRHTALDSNHAKSEDYPGNLEYFGSCRSIFDLQMNRCWLLLVFITHKGPYMPLKLNLQDSVPV